VLALDAIIGLTALGLRHPSEQIPLLKGMDERVAKLADQEMPRPDFVVSGHAQARKLLTEGRIGRFVTPSRRQDALNPDTAGSMPVFGLIGAAIECPAWKFISAANESGSMSARSAREMFVQTWRSDSPRLEDYPPSAFGRA
jgi:hypothetical protein